MKKKLVSEVTRQPTSSGMVNKIDSGLRVSKRISRYESEGKKTK